MSKKKNLNKKPNKIAKIRKKGRNINKKSESITSFIKENQISKKTVPLKTKKNQLRCHYCHLPMLRSNYARHLKTQHRNSLNISKKINKETIKKESYKKSNCNYNTNNSKSSSFISKFIKSKEREFNSESKSSDMSLENNNHYNFINHLRNADDNKINLKLEFGDIDYNGTIIYKFPNSTNYKIYTFKKSTFSWNYAITKYDIPQLDINRPREFSVFSSISDIKQIKKFYEVNHDKIILQEYMNIQKKNIQGINLYVNIDSISDWKVIYKNEDMNSDNKDDILVEIYFPTDFPFENPWITIEYYTYGLINQFMNSDEYMLIKHFWKPWYKIEKLIIDIKNILDKIKREYKPKNVNEEKKKKYYEKIKFICENPKFKKKIDNLDFYFNYELLEIKTRDQKLINEDIIEPIPTTNYCEICKLNYIEYKSHLKSRFHRKNLRKYKFDAIKEIFKRIINETKNQ